MYLLLSRAIDDLRRLTRLWLWLYLGRLVLALLITLPLLGVIGPGLDRSLLGQTLKGEWSLDVVNELVINNPGFVTLYVFLAIFLGIIALFVKQFLNGGIYRSLVYHQPLTTSDFFSYCGCDFTGHLRVSLFMLPVYVALAVLGTLVTLLLPPALFGAQGTGAIVSLFSHEWILWILLIFGSIFSDLMRIVLATSPGLSVFDYWRAAWSLFKSAGVQAIGVYAAFYLPFVILWIVIELMAIQLTGAMQNGLGVILEFLLFQLCSFARSGQSLLGSAGLTALVQSQPAVAAPVETNEVETI